MPVGEIDGGKGSVLGRRITQHGLLSFARRAAAIQAPFHWGRRI
jgi:hypothetical protein